MQRAEQIFIVVIAALSLVNLSHSHACKKPTGVPPVSSDFNQIVFIYILCFRVCYSCHEKPH